MAISLITFLIISCLVFPPPTSCTTNFNNETDFLSLLAFKASIDLDPSGVVLSWNETLNHCSWNGIRCSQRHRNRVVQIQLMSRGLVGSLSPHLGNLSFLNTIVLQNNTFHGRIPEQLTALRRLKVIEMSNNSLSGPIPGNLSNNLVYINLIDNKLSGHIPLDLLGLSKLEALGLTRNNFPGPIPPLIGNLTLLQRLSLSDCGLIGEIPESFTQLRYLKFLWLSDNALIGTIPSFIFNLSNLQALVLSFNSLDGVIPSTIGLTLPNLENLLLVSNRFSGPVPVSLSNASLLRRIKLNGNLFTGRVPSLARLTNLQSFLIGDNAVEDDISTLISSLTNSSRLVYLEIGGNRLHGSLPAESIGNLSLHLISLAVHSNNIHGKIPSGIGNLVNLQTLLLYNNYFEGPLPLGIAKLSKLILFDAGGNYFTGTLPSFKNFTLLSGLHLNLNNFSGNIPSTLGNLPSLLDFDLSHNYFNGLMPKQLMQISSSVTIVFNLSHNALEGSIPYEVASLVNLGALDLSNNRFSGEIPNSLGFCGSLQILRLQGNLLEGEIPSGISGLMGLQDLDLSRNNLSGPIPSFVEKLNLKNLNLSFNQLQGEVPTGGVFANKTSFSLDGNKHLCGGVLALGLPPCSFHKSKNIKVHTLLKILIPVLVVGGTCLVILAFRRGMSPKSAIPLVPSFTGVEFLRLSYADLLKATDEFSEANFLGGGRFGKVYKGVLVDGQSLVAVKVLNMFVRGASKSFMAECNALRNVRHRNLLKIVSVCESIDFRGNDFVALVYEFKPNGSLDKFLYHSGEEEERNGETSNVLKAIERLNIAIDIAQAVEYLHSGTDSCIIHGDLKPSNILLDQEMTACVGDFGLAKIVSDIAPSHENNSSIGIRGTIGYVPPEYGTSNSVSTQGDVYSYGIVVLEMFTNKRPTDDSFADHVNLQGYVSAALQDRVMEIIDPQLRRSNNEKMKDCMAAVLGIGISCAKEMPSERMLMSDVVIELHNIQKLLSHPRNYRATTPNLN